MGRPGSCTAIASETNSSSLSLSGENIANELELGDLMSKLPMLECKIVNDKL